jgi:hypothetical protein
MKHLGTDSIEKLKQEKREKDVLNKISTDLRALPSSPEESSLVHKPQLRRVISIPIAPIPEDEWVIVTRHADIASSILGMFSLCGSLIFSASVRDIFRIQPKGVPIWLFSRDLPGAGRCLQGTTASTTCGIIYRCQGSFAKVFGPCNAHFPLFFDDAIWFRIPMRMHGGPKRVPVPFRVDTARAAAVRVVRSGTENIPSPSSRFSYRDRPSDDLFDCMY